MPSPCHSCVSANSSKPMNVTRRAGRALSLLLAVAGFGGLTVPMGAQTTAGAISKSTAVDPAIQRNVDDWLVQGRGVVEDWSHHRLMYSNPGTEQEALEKGTYEHWLAVAKEPRYTLQVLKRSKNAGTLGTVDESAASAAIAPSMKAAVNTGRGPGMGGPSNNKIDKDWSMDLGGATEPTLTGTITTNGATSSSTIEVDSVTLDASAPVAASATGTVTTNNASGTSTITVDGVTLTASAPTAATGTGTVTTNGATSSSSLTIDGVTLTASGPTAATDAGTLTTNNATGSSTVTVDGQILTASAPTTATGTGTVTSNGATGTSTVTVDGVTLTASAPVAATATGTLTSNSATGTSTIVVDGVTLTASAPTTATGTGTVATNNATTGSTVTIDGVTLTASSPVAATATGTVSSNSATGSSTVTLDGVTLTASAPTAATGTGTVGSNNATTGSTVTIDSVTLTASAPVTEVGTFTEDAAPATGVTLKVGSVTYTFSSSTLGTPAANNCNVYNGGGGGSRSTTYTNLYAAMTNSTTTASTTTWECAGGATPNSAVSTVLTSNNGSGHVITVTATTAGSTGFTETADGTDIVWAQTTAGSDGTTGPTTFAYWSGAAAATPTQLAANITTAINDNTTLQTVLTGVSATSTGAVITVTARSPGTTANGYGTADNFTGLTWGSTALTGGANGTASSTTFPYWSGNAAVSTTQLATNITTAINANSTLTALFTTTSTGAVITVTDKTAGSGGNSYTSTSSMTGFAWGSGTLTGGSDGTTGATTFAYWSVNAPVSATQLATNITSAINANTTLQNTTMGVSATSSTNAITVTARAAGSTGNTLGTANNFSGLTWGKATLSGGADGTTSGTTFAYWSGNAAVSTTTLAANIATAINTNTTLQVAATGASATSSGAVFTAAARTAGTGGNSYTISGTLTGLTLSGATFSGGNDGTTGATTFAYWSVNAPVSTTQLATNITSAINASPTLQITTTGVSATSSTNVITVTARAAGSTGNSLATTSSLTGFAWGTADLSGGSDGTTSGTTFAYWSGNAYVTPTVLATNIATAINENTTLQTVATGVSATSSTNVVTVTARTAGSGGNSYTASVANLAGLTWGNGGVFSGGGNGNTTGTTFAYTGLTTTQLATNITSAINSNSTLAAAVTATSSGGVVTLTAVTPGTTANSIATTETSFTGFTWGAGTLSSGTNGTASGTTFPYWSGAAAVSTTQLATNITTAINANTTLQGAATGVSATSSGAVVTITARTAGSGGNSYATSVASFPGFAWTDGAMSGGSDGTTSGTTFAYWSVNAQASVAQLAANIASAINQNTTLQSTTTGVYAVPSSTTVVVTGRGVPGTSYGTATASLTGFSWGTGGAFAGGATPTLTGAVGAGNYPAKFSFDLSGSTPVCGGTEPDFVVYNTAVAGSPTQASLVAYDNLYVNNTGTGPCAGVTEPSVFWAYNTGGNIQTSPVFWLDGTQMAVVNTPTSGSGAASLVVLKWAPSATARTLTANVTGTTFTATSGTLVSTDVGAQVSGPGIPANDTIASVNTVANTGTFATAATAGSGEAINILAETPSTPGSPTMVTPPNYNSCIAPCMTTVTFRDGNPDTNSSPFVDYANDTIYVGDDKGYLHKFIFAFENPQEASGWPVPVSTNVLTSPVYTSTAYVGTTLTPEVFVADTTGHLYGFNVSNGDLVGESNQLTGSGSTVGIVDSPLVDGVANNVYASVGYDGNTATGASCDTTGCEGVFRFSVNSTSATTNPGNFTVAAVPATICSATSNNATTWNSGTVCGVESVFGIGSPSYALYDGAFDNTYYTEATEGSGGDLWTCADYASTSGVKLMSSPISSTGFGTTDVLYVLQIATNVIKPLTSGAATCSPVTEIYNGSTDWIFFSVTANGSQTTTPACTGACLYNVNVTSEPAITTATAGIAATGGTSGIVVDNTSTDTGASQIYYSPLGNMACSTSGGTSSGCAVQASQSAP
jgi:hypothetical protein